MSPSEKAVAVDQLHLGDGHVVAGDLLLLAVVGDVAGVALDGDGNLLGLMVNVPSTKATA